MFWHFFHALDHCAGLPREFDHKVWYNNQSVEKVLVKHFSMIYNTKLKFTGLLMDAGNRRHYSLSSLNLLSRSSALPMKFSMEISEFA